MRQFLFGWLTTMFALVGTIASAAPVLEVPLSGGYLDVEYFAGGGAQTAYFVIDFGGNGGDTYAFGYRWDGQQTAEQALFAIAAAGDLDFLTNNFGSVAQPNLFLSLVTYGSEADDPDFDFDGRFWNFSLGTYAAQDVTWSPSDYGISGRNFVTGDIEQFMGNGGFHGFYAGASFPSFPTLPVAVPEPSALVLLLIGAGICLRCARRRAKMA